MKFKKLTIHNVASIQDAEIDFDGDILRDEPLFLISGATGTGKSTILDAICLALYGDTPRMTDGTGRSEQFFDTFNASRGKGDKKDLQVKGLPLNHRGQLLRRGTYEAWAWLSFEADGTDYIAKWSVSRANKRPDGNLKNPENSLENLTTHEVWKKRAELKEVIAKVVGLSFDEFCRTTMLAQGDFAQFLESNADERSSILEKLTHTEVYSRISEKIYTNFKQHEEDLRRAEEKLGDIRPLSEEELAQRQAVLASLRAEKREWEKKAATLTGQYQWLDREKQQAVKLREKEQLLAEWRETGRTPHFLAEQADIADHAATAQPRMWLDDLEKLVEEKELLGKRQRVLKGKYTALCTATGQLSEKQQEDGRRQEEVRQWLDCRAADAAMLADAAAITEVLIQMKEEQSSAESKKAAADRGVQLLPEKEKAEEDAKEKEKEAAAAVEQQQQWLGERRAGLEALRPHEVQQRSEELHTMLSNIVKADTASKQLMTSCEHLQQAMDELRKEQEREQHLSQETPRLAEQLEKAREQDKQAQQMYDLWNDSLEKSWVRARGLLRKGCKCPLCLQQVGQDHVADPDYETTLRPVLERREAAREQMSQAEAELKSNRKMLEDCRKAVVEKEKRCQREEQNAGRLMEGAAQAYLLATRPFCHTGMEDAPGFPSCLADVAVGIPHCISHLEACSRQTNELSEEVGKQWENILAVNEEIEKGNKELNRRQRLLTSTQKSLADAQKTCHDLRTKITSDKEQAEDFLRRVAAKAHDLDSRISYKEWRADWETDPEALLQHLKADAAIYQEKKEREKQLERQVAERGILLQHIRETRSVVERCATFMEGDDTKADGGTIMEGQVLSRWQQLSAEVSEWMARKDSMEQSKLDKQQRVRAFLEQHPEISPDRLMALKDMTADHIRQLETSHNDYHRALDRAEGELGSLKQQYEEHLSKKPAMEDGTTMEQLAADIDSAKAEDERAGNEIGRLMGELEENAKVAERFRLAIEERDRKKKDFERWKRFSDLFGSADGKKFRTIAQSFILNHLLRRANQYLCQFTDRYELTCRPGAITIYVRDRFTNQAPQSVKVLSGGESFMVSLSLALALSHLNPVSTNFGILFIDEGFGSLDENSLNQVLETLERLHQIGGRRVGLISHVAVLEQNIHTQIQVSHIDATKSKVEIRRV